MKQPVSKENRPAAALESPINIALEAGTSTKEDFDLQIQPRPHRKSPPAAQASEQPCSKKPRNFCEQPLQSLHAQSEFL